MLMAMHILWWGPLVSWHVENTGFFEESIHESWSSVELYNRYRFLYEAIIVGVVAYVLEITLVHQLQNPEVLLEYAKNNNKSTHNFDLTALDIPTVLPLRSHLPA